MQLKNFFLAALFSLTAFTGLAAKDYNILDFGAKPDGKTLNTSAIQSAIDEAHKAGGGRVIIPAGRFLTGSIVIKTGVELHILKKGILLGSPNPDHYIVLKRWKGFVLADHAENIAITGKGTIDGQGCEVALKMDSLFYAGKIDSNLYQFNERRVTAHVRPQLIEFVKCKNIRVTGVTLKNSAAWVQTYDLCENLIIDGIRVDSDCYWNNDGLDLSDCKNVRVNNCDINASDDGICIKSPYRDGTVYGSDSIYIGNCTVRSSASAVKFGTASYGTIRNVVIENIKVYDTFRSAIAVESVNMGTLENVLIQNVKAVNTGNAIFIRIGKRKDRLSAGVLRNVTIRNVKVQVPKGIPDEDYEIRGPMLPFFHNTFPASITGIPGQPVENITLENIEIIYPGGGNACYANLPLNRMEDVPEKIKHYPEFSMFGELPAWAFYVRHVEGLTLKSIKVKIKEKDYRPAFVFDDVKGLKMEEIEIKGDDKPELIIRNNVKK